MPVCTCNKAGNDRANYETPSGTNIDIDVPCLRCHIEKSYPIILGYDPFLLYNHYKNGHLLDSGGISEQPAIYDYVIAVISALDSTEAQYEREQHEKEIKNRERKYSKKAK